MERREGWRPRKEGSRPLVKLRLLRLGLRPDVLPAPRGLCCRPGSSSGPSFQPSARPAWASFPSSRSGPLLLHRIFPSSSCQTPGCSKAGLPEWLLCIGDPGPRPSRATTGLELLSLCSSQLPDPARSVRSSPALSYLSDSCCFIGNSCEATTECLGEGVGARSGPARGGGCGGGGGGCPSKTFLGNWFNRGQSLLGSRPTYLHPKLGLLLAA